MKRREFLKTAPVFSVGFVLFPFGSIAQTSREKASYSAFPYLKVRGSYQEIGFQIGRHFRDSIRTVINLRSDWHNHLLQILESPKGKQLSEELRRLTNKHFPHLLKEIEGLADGAGFHFRAIWAITIKSELGAFEAENPGCSTIVNNQLNQHWLFHNEDGHNAYHECMFVVQVSPPSGVDFISMVYPGTLTGNGPSMNRYGVIQTTNFISSTKSHVGLPRYILGRAILEARSLEEAVQIATMEPRSYPYHHNLASVSEKKYLSVETTPKAQLVYQPDGIYFHTNHLLQPITRASHPYEDADYVNGSSRSRYRVIESGVKRLRKQPSLKVTDFLQILSSHRSAPYSPCRHPMGDVQGRTLGTAFFNLEKGVFRLYRGNPCIAVVNNFYREYSFSGDGR